MTVKEQLQFFADHGMSISYIASQIGINPSTLTKWLNGQKGITHKNEEKVFFTLNNILENFQEILGGKHE